MTTSDNPNINEHVPLRFIANDLRAFVKHYGVEIPNNIVSVETTANLLDVVADRLERRGQ